MVPNLEEDSKEDDDGRVGNPHVHDSPSLVPLNTASILGLLNSWSWYVTRNVQIMIGIQSSVVGASQVNLKMMNFGKTRQIVLKVAKS